MTQLNSENKNYWGLRQVRSVRSVSVTLRRWVARWQNNSFWCWFRPTWKRNPGMKDGSWGK